MNLLSHEPSLAPIIVGVASMVFLFILYLRVVINRSAAREEAPRTRIRCSCGFEGNPKGSTGWFGSKALRCPDCNSNKNEIVSVERCGQSKETTEWFAKVDVFVEQVRAKLEPGEEFVVSAKKKRHARVAIRRKQLLAGRTRGTVRLP